MKRIVIAGSAMLSAVGQIIARARDHAAEIRDLAVGSPMEVCDDCLRVHSLRVDPSCPHCLRDQTSPDERLAMRIRSILGPRNDDSRAVPDLIDELCEELDAREPLPDGWLLLPEDFFTHAGDFEDAIELAISCTGDPEGYWTHQLKTLRLAKIAAGYGPDGWGGSDLKVTP